MKFLVDSQSDALLEDFHESDYEGTAMYTGNARLPQGVALYEYFKVISCVLIVDLKTTRVIDAAFTTVSSTAAKYLNSLVVGWELKDGFGIMEKKMTEHCHMNSRKAFLRALEVAYQKFLDHQEALAKKAQ